MNVQDLLKRLASVQTMPELDAMRMEVVTAMKAHEGQPDAQEHFDRVQRAFIKAKNRLQHIPLRDRTW